MTKKTFISLLYVLMCTVCFGQEFVHPGMLHTISDLEFMKAKILAGEEPWKEHGISSKIQKLPHSAISQLHLKLWITARITSPIMAGKEFVRDGAAAYTMALQWYVEGEQSLCGKSY